VTTTSHESRPAFPVVTCPGCQKPMTPIVTEAGPHHLHTTTYRCERCGAETDRAHVRDGK